MPQIKEHEPTKHYKHMNKMRDSTPMSRPDCMSKIRIRYEQPSMKNGVRLLFTDVFPNDRLTVDWYEA